MTFFNKRVSVTAFTKTFMRGALIASLTFATLPIGVTQANAGKSAAIANVMLMASNYCPDPSNISDISIRLYERTYIGAYDPSFGYLLSIIGTTYGGNNTLLQLPNLFGKEPDAKLKYCFTTSGLNQQEGAGLPYISEIRLFTTKFCPAGWAETRGQYYQIAQASTLYALLGNRFDSGPVSHTRYALPNLAAPVAGTRYCIAVLGDFPTRN